ncbi:MAG: hypothetical protein R3F62_10220 [Planctomycetota bacterium]
MGGGGGGGRRRALRRAPRRRRRLRPRRLSHAASELVPVGGRPYRARLSADGAWLATVYAEARQRGDDRYQTLSAVAYRCPRADAPRPLCFSPPRTLTSARLPVSDLAWPGGSGYRGLQSTPDDLALLYEQSDADADRVLIGGLRVEGLDVAPLPPVALLTLAPWPEGEVRLGRNVQSAPDGEALLVVHTQATPLGEGVFASRLARGRVTDAALPIGAPYPQDSLARRPGGLLPPQALSSTSWGETSILFYGARDADDFGYGALFTRKLDLYARGSLQTRLVPAPYLAEVGARWKESPLPIRLDHQDLPVQDVQALRQGTSILVLFTQDRHAWAQRSGDGVDFLTLNGDPNPALVDNDTSEGLVWARMEPDPEGFGWIVLLAKRDGDGDLRLGLRAGSGF